MFVTAPLAETLRPRTLDEYIGQEHLTGKDAPLRRLLDADKVPSMILWGPPGTGKTTLANIIACTTHQPFYQLSATGAGVNEVRDVLRRAQNSGHAILFIDEIHRFSKSQQDSLLEAVERGYVTLIGATTENPSFEVISALLSRCQIYTLKSFGAVELERLLNKAKKYYKDNYHLNVDIRDNTLLFRLSEGDGRKLLNALELVVESKMNDSSTPKDAEDSDGDPIIEITNAYINNIIQNSLTQYDKKGDQHYSLTAALIKAIRGSDPNAAVYWLARMIDGGEDPKFIARRLLIHASEDIGLANNQALVLANTTFDAVSKIGYPEAATILTQCTIYLACCPKSPTAEATLSKAREAIEKTGDLPVPIHLREANTKLLKQIGYGSGFKSPYKYPGNFVNQEYMPAELSGTLLYDPSDNIKENNMRQRMKALWGDKYPW